MVKDMTKGDPAKLILQVAIPVFLGSLFQKFYNAADTVIVGRILGTESLAAVGSTGSLNFLVMGFVQGVSIGCSIPVAQRFGAGDHENLRRHLSGAVWLCAAITVLLTILTVSFCGSILRLMQTPDDIFHEAHAYLSVIYMGIGATFLYNLLAGWLRALGDTKSPLIFLVISSVLNIILDLVFILGLDAGVAGAAWATVTAQMVSGLLCLVYIIRKFPILHVRKNEWALSPGHLKELACAGLPMGLQMSITAIGGIILQSAVNTLGSITVAAITACNGVCNLLQAPIESICSVSATFSGQNMGARRIDRVRKGTRASLIMSAIYSVAAYLIAVLFGTDISKLFISSSDPVLYEKIRQFLSINCLFFFLLAMVLILRNTLQGLGAALPAMCAGFCEMAARASLGLWMIKRFGFNAACFSNASAWIAACLLLVPTYCIIVRRMQRQYPSSGD
ncbi:MAG: MATE family efflux transporter [Oscillospiraceae bacterium]|nr:MATE family efflux transporter [Oscillospiraceae bacterium]